MMKVSRSFLAVAIAVIMTCVFVNTSSIATAETYPARATKVLVLCDESYRSYIYSCYGEYTSDIIDQFMKLAAYPFHAVWNNDLDITVMSYEDVIGIPYSQTAGEDGCNNVWHWEYDNDGNLYRAWNHTASCNCVSSGYCIGGTNGYHHISDSPILNAMQQYKQNNLTTDESANISTQYIALNGDISE